jgi:hypothetical protein
MTAQGQKEIFRSLKSLITPYARKKLAERSGGVKNKASYALVSEKEVDVNGRKMKEIYFVGIIAQKGYVGFYYMPVYCLKEAAQAVGPELKKLQKGKCCFYVKKISPELKAQVRHALKAGYALYKKQGWV